MLNVNIDRLFIAVVALIAAVVVAAVVITIRQVRKK